MLPVSDVHFTLDEEVAELRDMLHESYLLLPTHVEEVAKLRDMLPESCLFCPLILRKWQNCLTCYMNYICSAHSSWGSGRIIWYTAWIMLCLYPPMLRKWQNCFICYMNFVCFYPPILRKWQNCLTCYMNRACLYPPIMGMWQSCFLHPAWILSAYLWNGICIRGV